jgi:hypothetical protein
METYKIAELGNYYSPDIQGRRRVRISEETYESVKEAESEINRKGSEIYRLTHNEAGRPDYYIIDENVAEYLETGRNYDLGNYYWDNADCDCGECDTCCQMMINQDRQYVINNSVEEETK